MEDQILNWNFFSINSVEVNKLERSPLVKNKNTKRAELLLMINEPNTMFMCNCI